MLDLSRRVGDELYVITGHVLETHPVTSVTAEAVEAGGMAVPRELLCELVKPSGGRAWIAQADLPARIAAEQVYRLRHSSILQSLFSDDSPSVSRVPWQVWGIVALCLAFLGLAAMR